MICIPFTPEFLINRVTSTVRYVPFVSIVVQL
jgi:hypothetical protein